MDCGYEMRQTKFQAEDYGAVDHQSRDFLLASKIGLPILPRILSADDFADTRQGRRLKRNLKKNFVHMDLILATKCVEALNTSNSNLLEKKSVLHWRGLLQTPFHRMCIN